jgi:type VI secretion system secreted protein Hcp
VTKDTDVASTKLLNESYQGEGQKVTIDFCKTDQGNLEVYLSFELEDVMISGLSMSSGGDRPTESVSLNFTKISVRNIGMTDTNSTASPDTVTYDVAQAKVV